jgi:hypothetical protein
MEKIHLRTKYGKKRPHPQKQFIEDIIQYINERKDKGHEILLTFDGNDLASSPAVERIRHECGLYDIMLVPGGDTNAQLQDTFIRGNRRRIDHILGLQRFQEARRRYGALEYNNGLFLDHRGLFVDFDPAILFAGQVKSQFNTTTRGFTSKNDRKVQLYMDKVEKYWIDHKISDRVSNLQQDADKITRQEIR